MKSIFALAITLFVLIMSVIFLGLYRVDTESKTTENWDVSDPEGSVNGTWGTEIIVGYMDGTTENLNDPLPVLDVYFKDKKVDYFKYSLSTRGTSNTYEAIDIDLSSFDILVYVSGEPWSAEKTFNQIEYLDMNGEWEEVYTATVNAESLESLDVDRTYNLSFTPSGTITYRGSSTGPWSYVPLPNWFYLKFKVKTETSDDIDDDDIEDIEDQDRWIQVEVEHETGDS